MGITVKRAGNPRQHLFGSLKAGTLFRFPDSEVVWMATDDPARAIAVHDGHLVPIGGTRMVIVLEGELTWTE